MKDCGPPILGTDYNIGEKGKRIPIADFAERHKENLEFYGKQQGALDQNNDFVVIEGGYYPAWKYVKLFYKKFYVPKYLFNEICSFAEMFSSEQDFKNFVEAWWVYVSKDGFTDLTKQRVEDAKKWIIENDPPSELQKIWKEASEIEQNDP